MDEDDEYGDIPDEDFIEALSQPSQTLPELPPAKRRRISYASDDDEIATPRPRRSRESTGDNIGSGEEENERAKKRKYKIHIADKDVPAAKTLGATQAEALPDSSPYRIRGPIYKKARPEPPKPPPPPRAASARVDRPAPPANTFFERRVSNPLPRPQSQIQIHEELVDLPSDAFSSPESKEADEDLIFIGSSPLRQTQDNSRPRQRLVAPQQGLRQTTLFGGRAAAEPTPSQAKNVHNFIVDKPPEAPTHHALDLEALKTWVYPTNLGDIRAYQYSIVKHGLFNNLLVALPTGLGKTFIAATIMYNYFRWTKDAKIVFIAPTKPLVAQQVDACFNIVGIPRSQTTMLTGDQPPVLRAEEWEDKRVFFMTPQTLDNDLRTGIADPKKIVLLVVDEAHRATGNYSYVKVVELLRRFNKSFRILALTATPGANVEAVQEVIDGLEISKVEIRTEESIDIQQYVHRRDIDQIVLDPSDEIIMIKELFAKALQPLVNQLCGQNAYYNKDPMNLTPFGLIKAKAAWFASDAGKRANPGLKGMILGLFAILASISHSIKLLNYHGIGPFYSAVKDFRQGVEDANKPGKWKSKITDHPDFKKMMDTIALWLSKDDFVGHPKLTYLCDTILNHFLDAGEGRLGDDAPPSSTRVIVFSEFRDSAEDIARVLNRHGPMIRASVFVGQQDSKRSEGMNQAKQQETISKFKKGIFNVIVATSIGEEGLDIGQVDLIVCYDASGSPIRMLQRMGRTGRKRAGNIVLLLMRGKEEESFAKAKDNYESMQKMISDGTRFNFRHDLSVRIIPREITPVVDKRIIEIPIENTQSKELPEPKRRVAKNKKRPPKKFHMPDGVQTGFQKASKWTEDGIKVEDSDVSIKPKKVAKTQLAPIPAMKSVFLTPAEEKELHRKYLTVSDDDLQEVAMPDMTAQTAAQRLLAATVKVPHGQYTRRCVTLFSTLADSQDESERYLKPYGNKEPTPDWDVPKIFEDEDMVVMKPARKTKTKQSAKPKPKLPKRQSLVLSDMESEGEGEDIGFPQGGYSQGRALAAAMSDNDSEGEGDDLLHSELPSQDTASDNWGSLKDFVIEDEEEQSSSRMEKRAMPRSSTTPPTTDATPKANRKRFEATQDTFDEDEELPDLSQLTGRPPATAKSVVEVVSDEDEDEEEEEDEEDDVRPVSRGKSKRQRVVESDSDE
ncbi:P-loop containing nucleoside triphosphate hydrolase protein [Mollisia scopiformis]|uniref:ATP-dependent DNA helicase n=1 Tax=Mollisia scopiformis TaxID=149040 RepID=A0A194XR18_MOLSC|nr:P-loop containing nucleoside triphosphate hydrolase protein [Mollisia scopiformis]KUJ22499.1 P-loop containing nucleoside triphosphate hydrolase protein [Mollisia scopiformis]